jgi:hypothetical protein
MKAADVSTEARPLSIAEPWVDRLFEEFFLQSDIEKQLGIVGADNRMCNFNSPACSP